MKKHLSKIDDAVGTIRDLTTRLVVQSFPGSGKHPVREVRTPVIELTLGRARKVLLAAEVSSAPDGYSATTPGNGAPGGGKGGGRRMGIVDRETGMMDWVPTSSTEAAAIDPARREPDPVARSGRKVNVLMLRLAATLAELDRELDQFDVLRSTSTVPEPPMCWVAQTRYRLPWDLQWEPFRTTDFAGQLDTPFDEPRKVCSFVYWYVRNHKRLPLEAEMREYLTRETIRIRG